MAAIGHALDSLKALAAVVTTAMAADRAALLEAVRSPSAQIEPLSAEPACSNEPDSTLPDAASRAADADPVAVTHSEPRGIEQAEVPAFETEVADARPGEPGCDVEAAPAGLTASRNTDARSVTLDNDTVLALTAALSKDDPDAEPLPVAVSDIGIETAAAFQDIVEIASAHPSGTEAAIPSETEATTAAPAPANAPVAAAGSVVELSKARALRERRGSTIGRRLLGAMAAIAIAVGGTIGIQGALQSEAAQRLIELSACDADAMAASRECALIGWLLL